MLNCTRITRTCLPRTILLELRFKSEARAAPGLPRTIHRDWWSPRPSTMIRWWKFSRSQESRYVTRCTSTTRCYTCIYRSCVIFNSIGLTIHSGEKHVEFQRRRGNSAPVAADLKHNSLVYPRVVWMTSGEYRKIISMKKVERLMKHASFYSANLLSTFVKLYRQFFFFFFN